MSFLINLVQLQVYNTQLSRIQEFQVTTVINKSKRKWHYLVYNTGKIRFKISLRAILIAKSQEIFRTILFNRSINL